MCHASDLLQFSTRRDSSVSSQASGVATIYHSYYLPSLSNHDTPIAHQSPTYVKSRESNHSTENRQSRHRRKVYLWLLLTFVFVVLCPLASVMVGIRLRERDFSIPAEVNSSFTLFNGRTLLVEAVLVSADPTSMTMIMDWIIIKEHNSPCGLRSMELCTDINIFFDNNLISGRSAADQPDTSDRPARPIFKLNATTFAQGDVTAKSPTFRTRMILFQPTSPRSSPRYFPLDQYSSEISMFAEDAQTNETVGIRIAKTRGVAADFKTHVQARRNVYIPPGMIDISISLLRSNILKVYVITVVTFIWIITLTLIILILTSVFFGFKQKTDVLIAPVATVFAFCQLRASIPGAPAMFGVFTTESLCSIAGIEGFPPESDFVGLLLPCLALLALSAAFTLGVVFCPDPTAESQTLNTETTSNPCTLIQGEQRVSTVHE